MQHTDGREVISIKDTTEHEQIVKALELYGAITRMQRGAELSRQAIINVRDNGRGEKTTIEKIRKYMRSNKKRVRVAA